MDNYRNRVKKKSHFHLDLIGFSNLFTLINTKNRLVINSLLLGLLVTCSPTVFAALSATTANVIQGTKPTIVNQEGLKKLLGFTVKSEPYSEKIGNIDPAITKMFSSRLKFSDFQAKPLDATDILLFFQDTDGDHADPINPFTTITPIAITWKDSGTPINNLNQTIGTYTTPLTMEISTTISVNSEFGLPNISDPVTVTQIYTIDAKEGIYYLKPASMQNLGRGGVASNFIETKGFTIDSGFPTTGFENATFELKPQDGDIAGYTFSVVSGSGATVDSSGKVTLNSNNYPVVIKASKSGADAVEDFIEINITKWARVPQGSTLYDYKTDNNIDQQGSYPAADVCAGTTNTDRTPEDAKKYFFNYTDLTDAPITWGDGLNTAKRAVGTFIGEWGSLAGGDYPNSPFTSASNFKNIWTSEDAPKEYKLDEGKHYYKKYVVFLPTGRVGTLFATKNVDGEDTIQGIVVCKKD